MGNIAVNLSARTQFHRGIFATLLVSMLLCASPVRAETACQPGSDGVGGRDAFAQTPCDTLYRDEKLSCDNNRTVWGACPPKAMPHKRTKLLSFKDLSPYLWASLAHPTIANRKYDGPMYRGTPGDYRSTNQMISADDPTGKNRFAACIHQIEIRGTPAISKTDLAALIRLQLDNCANQYILQAAAIPSHQEDSKLMITTKRCGKPEPLTAKIACQPLTIEPSAIQNDYSVTPHLKASWGRMLQHVKPEDAVAGTPGVGSYQGYIQRKRSFGPFQGILGSIYNLFSSITQLASTIGNLANLAQIGVQLPNFSAAMDAIRGGLGDLTGQIANMPGQITSSLSNIQNTFARLGQNFRFQDSISNFTSGFGQMRQGLSGLTGLAGLPAGVAQGLSALPATMQSLTNIGPVLQGLPGALGNLQTMIPNIASLPQNLANIQRIAAGMPNALGTSLQGISQLPGQVGGNVTSAVGQARNALTGLPGAIGDVVGNTSIVLTNPADQVAGHLDRQAAALNRVNSRISGGGSLQSIGGNMANAGRIIRDIPNVNMAAGGMVSLSTQMESMNALRSVLQGGAQNPLTQALNPQSLAAFSQISQSMASMSALQGGLETMRQQMISGTRFPNLTLPQLDGYLANVRSYNNLMNSMNIGQISQLMNGMNTMRGALSIPQLPNLSTMANGMANNLQGMVNLNRFAGTLGSMQANVASAMGFGVGINFRSAAARMNVRKEREVFPSLPEGTIIRNPIPMAEIPEVKLSDTAKFPYEQILDPSHPFSPRNHYYVNDRDGYSTWGAPYSKDKTNNVFCAGEREDNPNTRENEVIKVDILESRIKKFEEGENALYDGIYQRIAFNDMCSRNTGAQNNPCEIKMKIALLPPITRPLHCMTCFGLRKRETDTPPCATNYLGEDRRMIMSPVGGVVGDILAVFSSIPGVSQLFEFKVQAKNSYMFPTVKEISVRGLQTRVPVPSVGMYASVANGGANPGLLCLAGKLGCKAACSVANVYRKSTIQQLCDGVRAPYTPMNKLKMRHAKREDDERDFPTEPPTAQKPSLQNELPSGVNDGLMHKDHFENRMPYPRLWDTGQSIQLKPSNIQDPRDQNGRFTSVVGVGREAVLPPSPSATPPAAGAPPAPAPRKDERCLIGGWGPDGYVNPALNIDIKRHDPVTSWTELKLYQARTLREFGINCLGRYERLFKPGAAEDHILSLAGGSYNERDDSCKIEAGIETERNVKFNMLFRNFPKAWRGYVADPGNDGNDAFPKFPDQSPTLLSGLDNARPGDVIIMPYGTEKNDGKEGLPILSYVEVTNNGANCRDNAGCSVTVIERGNGKWPDACGTTDAWGIESTRMLYKPGTMPDSIKNQIDKIDTAPVNYSCRDNDLQHCELDDWNSLKIYRIRDDRSRGGNLNPIQPPPATPPTP